MEGVTTQMATKVFVPNAVLAQLLQDDRVPLETLHERYHALLEVVRILLGVVPLCDPYLEIWPPAFQTYNVLVPNLLNLPKLMFINTVPREIVGLGMYASSRSAKCPYCAAHTFAFACRRGMDVAKLADVEARKTANFTPRELATMDVAAALGKVPSPMTPALRGLLKKHFNRSAEEWIVAGMCMMGFLNKFMDAIGVELEQKAANEAMGTIAQDGWHPGKNGWFLDPVENPTAAPKRDGIVRKIKLLPYLPSAKKYDDAQTRGIPATWPALGHFLSQITGHDFPLLGRLHHARIRRAIAAAIAKNLDLATSTINIKLKCLAAAIFSHVSQNNELWIATNAISTKFGVDDALISKAIEFADKRETPVFDDPKMQALIVLASDAASTPSKVDRPTLDALQEAKVESKQMVELVSWLAVLQLLNRFTAYFVEGWEHSA